MKRECDIILDIILDLEKNFNEKYKSKCLGQLAGQYSQYRFSTDNQSHLTRILSNSITVISMQPIPWASFVIPLAAFGIYNYGIRAISKVKDDKNKINYVFLSCFISLGFSWRQVSTSHYLLDTSIENLKVLYYILGAQALFQFLNIEWMNEVYGNYALHPS